MTFLSAFVPTMRPSPEWLSGLEHFPTLLCALSNTGTGVHRLLCALPVLVCLARCSLPRLDFALSATMMMTMAMVMTMLCRLLVDRLVSFAFEAEAGYLSAGSSMSRSMVVQVLAAC